eukprot:GHRQ01035011.1.p1 GENE.GHRQ01035011.1~~GHRQ01035011.1.p1  ORF type:complete len:258 (+),score=86.27 GHRQ01035011.1:171-944(+)
MQAEQPQQAAEAPAALPSATTSAAGPSVASCSKAETSVCRSPKAAATPQDPRSRGIWHQVKEEFNAAQKQQIHSSMAGGSNLMPAPVGTASLAAAAGSADTAAPLLGMDAAALLKNISLGAAGPGQCFCGCKFAQGWSGAAATAASAAGVDSNSGGDEGLSHAVLPCSCLAAVSEPNKVAALLVISRPVYMEACRLHREAHMARLVDMLCRLPCLRHTLIKELHRLAVHIKQATYQPGDGIDAMDWMGDMMVMIPAT